MNLLTDPVFRVDTPEGPETMSLPALLVALGADRVDGLPGLQRHQEDPFHIFTCYLAAAVLARERRDDARQDAAFWREGICRLTGNADDCAWTLLVEDVTKPAFMQPPVPKALTGKFNKSNPKAKTPDELDILQTAKNHDVKTRREGGPEPDEWVFALVSLQTTTGQMGRGNYGIARMNSGTGSRTCVGLVYETSPGGRWARDVSRLLAGRAELLAGPWGYEPDGHVVTWSVPWDLETPLPLSALDPFFIEVARAVRLARAGSTLVALSTGTAGNRISAKPLKGVLGDPWTVLVADAEDGWKAWTVRPPVFSPANLRDLLFGDGFKAPLMMQPDFGREADRCYLRGSVLASDGMGKTNGYHEIMMPIPGPAARRLFSPGPERDRLAARSKEAIEAAGRMQNRVLKPAVLVLLEGGPEQVKWEKDQREIGDWWELTQGAFSGAWTAEYFPWLWGTVDETDDEAARLKWLRTVHHVGRQVLADALARFPEHAGRRYRARAAAERVFVGSLFKQFPELKEVAHDVAGNG